MCSTGMFRYTLNNTCISCNPGCKSCTGPSLAECQSCKDVIDPIDSSIITMYYLVNGNSICSINCPTGQFKKDGSPNVCQMCSS